MMVQLVQQEESQLLYGLLAGPTVAAMKKGIACFDGFDGIESILSRE